MQRSHFKRDFTTTFIGLLVLLLGATLGFAQQQVNLSAAPATATLPDGSAVPMWGYSCGAAVTGSTATCAALNTHPALGVANPWSPVIITVPAGQDLQINLTNNLTFQPPTPSGGAPPAANNIPTSLVIVGQLGGGLGNSATSNPSPTHNNLSTSWPIASTGPEFVPPSQPGRVQSFATEVATGATTSLTWKAPRVGTYLLESGTHPSIQGPMGLYGMVVVTAAPTSTTAGTAYPNVSYGSDVPLLFSEIDAVQNRSVNAAVNTAGFSESATLGPFQAQGLNAISVVTGGHDYTSVPTVTISGNGCTVPVPANGVTCPATATATIDTDPTSPTYKQVTGITVNNPGNYTSSPAVVISGGGCVASAGNPCASADAVSQAFTSTFCSGGAQACYPAVVNYTPMYYMINGQAFDKTNASNSLFLASPTGTSTAPATGSVLVRMVNAGLRMHVPAIVGSQTSPKASSPAVAGFSLIAEDGNVLPGVPRVQNEVFMAAGKTYDVMINGVMSPATTGGTAVPYANALPVYDRELSLSGNSTNRDSGMLAYIGINGGGIPSGVGSLVAAVARPDTYNSVIGGKSFSVSDVSKGVLANDTNVFGVQLLSAPAGGTVTLNANGTFTYTANSGTTSDSFSYCANGTVNSTVSPATCSSGITATVTLGAATIEAASGISCSSPSFTSNTSVYLAVRTPGVLAACKDAAGYPLTVTKATAISNGLSVTADANGGFTASVPGPGLYSFTFVPVNSQGTAYSGTVTATINFLAGNGPSVTVMDGADHKTVISDYRWIIEEDRTFYMDPACTTNPLPAGCPTVNAAGVPPVFGTNFHTSYMPLVATGCTGTLSCEGGQTMGGATVVCDQGDGVCRPDLTGTGQTPVFPTQVHLDPTKRYYISVLPGDAAQPFISGYTGAPDCSTAGVAAGSCGHGMGGAPIGKKEFAANAVTVWTEPSPYPPAHLTVFVFEDDFPLNGEHDAGGGVDVLSPNEPGLGGFEITLADDAGGTGDSTGQPTYDMFNMPLTNGLAGTLDPVTGLDACPISTQVTTNSTTGDGSQKGIVGMVITCPYYESDGQTLSPLAGQAVIPNLYPGRYGVIATPGADRIGRGEEWLQTNTLDGQKAHDSFMRIGEPAYFQEYGPAGYHVTIGFANPAIIKGRLAAECTGAGVTCNNSVTGRVTTARMSRTPDERLYSSGSRDGFAFTQCYASLGEPDGPNFAFAKCDDQGYFTMSGLPAGNWRLVLFDQWNDQIVDGISTPVALNCSSTLAGTCSGSSSAGGVNLDLGEVATHQWQSNIYTRTFIDSNKDGVSNKDAQGNDLEGGLALVATNVRYRDGSFSNFNNTDLNGYAGFNEVFPLFNWYVVETDTTRYKTTGVHVVYDAGGPADGTQPNGTSNCSPTSSPACGTSAIGQNFANTLEKMPLPTDLRVPGSVYCTNADCTGASIATGPLKTGTRDASGPNCTWTQNSDGHGGTVNCGTTMSTGRIDPPYWFGSYGWQGFSGQSNFLEFGKTPYIDGETGGIHGHVVYASTRPFDDPQLLLQLSWEPLVPHVTVNLYQESTAPDGSQSLKLVDTTVTTSFDDWAQGFRADGKPYMNCPGELPAAVTSAGPADPFWFGLEGQPQYLDWYNSQHSGTTPTVLPYQSQFKCYDGMHQWNQLQPAPYDGQYSFPSVTAFDPVTGKPTQTNCDPTVCVANPDSSDPYRAGTPMLPPGKYVVEVVPPPGYELVKEEDKNILIGDNYIAPATQQFAGLGNVFILPDQAAIGDTFNSNSALNATQDLGRSSFPSTEGDTGSVEQYWPCVGELRTVPDFISLFPGSGEVAPFAGASRHLCDRKEVTLQNQSAALAKFYVFTSTHAASHFTGIILDDFTAEFDPYSPQFGEKFAPSYLPVALRDWSGNEVNRVYADMFGIYNGLNYSTWEVNPPNPTGYGPTMMVTCMNDPGQGATPDPLYQPNYSDFCYELAYMPGQTGYFDTPVTPTSAFSEGYNHPDCNYPDLTPAISSVTGDTVAGPWVANDGAAHVITIKSLGDQMVDNYGYVGPSATAAPFNQQKVKRHYGFGGTAGTVTVGGVPLTNVNWADDTITGTVNLSGTVNGQPVSVPQCAVQQQAQYNPTGGGTAYCGQLLITNANGQQSVDTVTVTIGGKQPTVLAAGQTIQSALDAALPGDMIIVPPGNYNELLIMWKPVRLQGVGAASSVINANTQPAGKLDPWRAQVDCLFGLTLDGRPSTGSYSGCPGTGWNGLPPANNPFPTMIVDREPLEAVLGWDANLNGNLAEQLIEPSLMGAYEGAAITVLGKGVNIPRGSADPFGSNAATAASFPAGTVLLMPRDCGSGRSGTNLYPSNFYCNPSSIDGLTLMNSSQGGGGIFVHGWAHNLQIANNRVKNNLGTMSGGITIGQGEHIDVILAGGTILDPPNSCENSNVLNALLPFCYNTRVNVHNNAVTLNNSLGDELFSSTPAGAGGVTFCNGADYYKFQYNWICGNMSTGDGGGFSHVGFIKNGLISHNTILFNQSSNPSITTNGGGVLIMGAPDLDPTCAPASNPDQDCVPDPKTVPPSDGAGPGLVIDSNLILGNAADSGSGGGLRLQQINGTDVMNFPNGATACRNVGSAQCLWNSVTITNNIIANNVAGWDGGGVSLQDAMAVNIVNNTIVSNDTTASSGTLFGSLFAPLASNPGVNCTTPNGTFSCPQPAGLVSVTHGAILAANLPTNVTCPPGHPNCKAISDPLIDNNVIWQNRAFVIGVGGLGSSSTARDQQSVVTIYNAAFSSGTTAVTPTSQPLSQAKTGDCVTGSSYWDIGVRGDLGPDNRFSGFTLNPLYSVLTDVTGPYANASSHNTGLPAALVSQYCNGSRVPPENGGPGYTVYPGTNETAGGPTWQWLFSLTPSAVVDEGNNWINMRWGPLALASPVTGAVLGNFAPSSTSSAINLIPSTAGGGQIGAYTLAPNVDFFGNPRKANSFVDAGAIEFQGSVLPPTYGSISPTSGYRGKVVPVTITGNHLSGVTSVTVTVNGNNAGVAVSNVQATSDTTITATFTIASNATLAAQNVTITTNGGSVTAPGAFTVLPASISSISPNSGLRGANVPVTITGVDLTGATGLNISGTGVTLLAGSFNVASDTQVTATLVIAPGAQLGTRTISVTTPNGSVVVAGVTRTNTVNFRVATQATVAFLGPIPPMNGGGTGTKNGVLTVINNSGLNGSPLTLTAAPSLGAQGGTGNGLFSITGGSCASGVVLNPGNFCTVNLRYTGQTNTNNATTTVTITDTGATTPTQTSGTITAN